MVHLPRVIVWSVMFFVTIACEDPVAQENGDGDSDGDSDTDTDGDSDSDSDSESDTDSDSGSDPNGECGDYPEGPYYWYLNQVVNDITIPAKYGPDGEETTRSMSEFHAACGSVKSLVFALGSND